MFYCIMGYISALTFYLLLLISNYQRLDVANGLTLAPVSQICVVCSLMQCELKCRPNEVTSLCELFMLFVCGQSQMIFQSVFTLHYSRVYLPERRTRHLS